MPLIPVGDRRVHVQELGEHGPLVVLIHPLTFSLAVWYFSVAPFLARSCRVLLYDLRGHGRSDPAPDGYDLKTLAGDLRDLLCVKLGATTPVGIAGWSSAGSLALRFALDHPDWTSAVAAVDAPMPPYPLRERVMDEGRDPEEIVRQFPSEEVPVTRGGRRRALRTNQHVRLRNETTFARDFEAEGSFNDELPGLQKPAFLLYGDQSPFLDVGQCLAARLPRAELEVIPGNHYIPLSRREQVADCLAGFFA
ncbi:MAG TPA: alpha/beta hydrolase [Longimicrobiales bacterium]